MVDARLESVALACRDVAAALTFYRDGLGFAVEEASIDQPMAVLQDHAVILLKDQFYSDDWPGDRDLRPEARGKGVVIAFYVSDVDAYFGTLKAKGITTLEEPTDRPWGVRSFMLQDREGYLLEFFQVI